jgi:SAM-dependent methyltransferase
MIDNPVRGRFNAWLLDLLDGYMHGKYGKLKSSLLGDVPSTVLELGPGAGANLRYYPPGTCVIAVEPNVSMHGRLRRHADRRGLRLELLPVGAEALPLEPESVDLVFVSLVLCSVSQPAAVIAEARRVLRPGGRFICIEHVAAPDHSSVAGIQRVVARPWRWLFEGCDLLRDTEALLRGSGFRTVEIQPIRVPTLFVPIRYQIAATCTV